MLCKSYSIVRKSAREGSTTLTAGIDFFSFARFCFCFRFLLEPGVSFLLEPGVPTESFKLALRVILWTSTGFSSLPSQLFRGLKPDDVASKRRPVKRTLAAPQIPQRRHNRVPDPSRSVFAVCIPFSHHSVGCEFVQRCREKKGVA